MEQSRERSSSPPLHLSVVAIEKGVFGSSLTMVGQLIFIYKLAPSLHLDVVVIEKGAFVSPSTLVTNFTFYSATVIQTHLL